MSSADADQQSAAKKSNSASRSSPRWYLLLSNPSKTTHLGTLLRCAAAFQVHQVLLVGYDKFNCQGSFGSHLFLDIVVFPTWDTVHDYLRCGGIEEVGENCNENDVDTNSGDENEISSNEPQSSIPIIGILGAYGGCGEDIFSPDGMAVYEDVASGYVSLVPPESTVHVGNQVDERCLPRLSIPMPHRSFPISKRPFSCTNVCFLMSKDKRGLPISQARMCSGFVHVPHLLFDDDTTLQSKNSTPPRQTTTPQQSIVQSNLLDSPTVLSIVLHHFTAWSRCKERTFAENQKFVKDIKPNARRRLCRVVGQKVEEKVQSENTVEADSNAEQQEAMDANIMLWREAGDASHDGDY